jgi:hypothetical protein
VDRLDRNGFLTQALFLTCLSIGLCLCDCRSSVEASAEQEICRPVLGVSPRIELGKSGQFEWTCTGGKHDGQGFYVVFVRPAGTYVLLKVPHGRTSFEFTPDVEGVWRWIVINTDPDRTKPDLESDAGFFQVITAGAP